MTRLPGPGGRTESGPQKKVPREVLRMALNTSSVVDGEVVSGPHMVTTMRSASNSGP